MILTGTKFTWLNDIPTGWNIKKVKNLFDISKVTTDNYHEYPVFSLTLSGIKERDKDSNEGQLPDSYEKYNLVNKDCLVLNPMDLLSGWVDVPPSDGLISPSYHTISLKENTIDLHFIKYYFQSLYKEKIFFNFGEGVHYEYRWGLGTETLKNFPIPVPPKSEQRKLVEFLDHKIPRISRLRNKISEKIKLIEEKKINYIREIISRGSDENVTLVKSNIEWIDKIPERWNVSKIKYVTTISRGKFTHRPRNDERMYGGEHPFIQTGDITSSKKYLETYKQTLSDDGFLVSKEFPKGTIVMTISGNIGDISILNLNCCFPDSIIGFTPKTGVNEEFLYYLFLTMKDEFLKNSVKSTQLNLNVDRVGSIKLPLPDLDEQLKIVRLLNNGLKNFDDIISSEEKRLELLDQYRISMTSDYVLGRRRVT